MSIWMRRGAKIAAWVGGSVLLLLAAANAVINLFVADLINQSQADVTVDFGRAWMLWPGRVWAKDVQIVGHDSQVEWLLTVEDVATTIDFSMLAKKTFRAHDAETKHARFRIRATRSLEALCRFEQGTLPSLPELANPVVDPGASPEERLARCLLQPDTARRSTGPADPADLWQVDLDRMNLADLQEVWIEGWRYGGSTHVSGGAYFWPTLKLEVRSSEVSVETGSIAVGRTPFAKALKMGATGRLAMTELSDLELQDVVHHLSVTATIAAHLQSVRFLNYSLAKAPWINLTGGGGDLSGRIRVDEGWLGRGTSMQLKTQGLAAHLSEYVIQGNGLLELTRPADPEDAPARLALHLGEVEVKGRNREKAHMRKGKLDIELQSNKPDLSQPLEDLQGRVRLLAATIPDFRVYNAVIPKSARLEILAGTATASGLMVIRDQNHAHGALELRAKRVRVRYRDLEIEGDLALDTNLVQGDLEHRLFNIDGSQIRLERVNVALGDEDHEAESWDASVDVTKSRIRPEKDPFFELHLVTQMKDLRPIWALYAANNWMPKWVRRALSGEGARGMAKLAVGDDLLRIERLEVRGAGVTIEALANIEEGHTRGALLLSHGDLLISVAVEDEESSIYLLAPRTKFLEKAAAWRSGLPMDGPRN